MLAWKRSSQPARAARAFIVPTATFKVLFVFLVLVHDRRENPSPNALTVNTIAVSRPVAEGNLSPRGLYFSTVDFTTSMPSI